MSFRLAGVDFNDDGSLCCGNVKCKVVFIVFDSIMEFVVHVFDSREKAESFISNLEEPETYFVIDRPLL